MVIVWVLSCLAAYNVNCDKSSLMIFDKGVKILKRTYPKGQAWILIKIYLVPSFPGFVLRSLHFSLVWWLSIDKLHYSKAGNDIPTDKKVVNPSGPGSSRLSVPFNLSLHNDFLYSSFICFMPGGGTLNFFWWVCAAWVSKSRV